MANIELERSYLRATMSMQRITNGEINFSGLNYFPGSQCASCFE